MVALVVGDLLERGYDPSYHTAPTLRADALHCVSFKCYSLTVLCNTRNFSGSPVLSDVGIDFHFETSRFRCSSVDNSDVRGTPFP